LRASGDALLDQRAIFDLVDARGQVPPASGSRPRRGLTIPPFGAMIAP
jgi:hypothetical protein